MKQNKKTPEMQIDKTFESQKQNIVEKKEVKVFDKNSKPKVTPLGNIKPLIGVISLGCDKNRVDTEVMLTLLKNAGYSFTADASVAQVIIVNTCCFIRSAREESEDTIAEMISLKRNGKCEKIIVTGCLPQYDMKSLKNEFPEADALLGINEYKNIVSVVENLYNVSKKVRANSSSPSLDLALDRITTTPAHYAYLKIADGCNNFCAFCTIPFIRGKYRSQEIEDLVTEASNLAARGVRELILVAQDTTRYGSDLYGEIKLVKLLRELSKIQGIKWIRLLYCYPEFVSDELIKEILTNPKMCKYIDVPFQHSCNTVLKRMNRHVTETETIELAKKLTTASEFIAVRTTFMVGFPGETKKEFNHLYAFIKQYKLTNVGFFAFSREAGTEAFNMLDQIDEATKNRRLIKLVKLQKKIHRHNAKKNFVGKIIEVVCESFDDSIGLFVGRSQYQAPEIDTLVFFRADTQVKVGEFVKIKIKKVRNYDLEGEKI